MTTRVMDTRYSDKAANPPSAEANLQTNLHHDRTTFFDLSFCVENLQGASKDLIAAGRKAAIMTLKLLATVNDTLVLCIYNPDGKVDKTVKAINAKGGLSYLLKMQNKLAQFFDGFRVQGDTEYILYMHVRLSFNGNNNTEENFITSARALLAKEKGYLYQKTLQVADMSTIGFLLNSHEHMDIKGLQQFFMFQMDILDRQHWVTEGPFGMASSARTAPKAIS